MTGEFAIALEGLSDGGLKFVVDMLDLQLRRDDSDELAQAVFKATIAEGERRGGEQFWALPFGELEF